MLIGCFYPTSVAVKMPYESNKGVKQSGHGETNFFSDSDSGSESNLKSR